jgi:hypothetical protein
MPIAKFSGCEIKKKRLVFSITIEMPDNDIIWSHCFILPKRELKFSEEATNVLRRGFGEFCYIFVGS